MPYIIIAVLLTILVELWRMNRKAWGGPPREDWVMGVIWIGGIVISFACLIYGAWELRLLKDWVYGIFR